MDLATTGDLYGTAPNYAGAAFPPPRDFQVTAHQALREGVKEGHRCQLLMSPTGSGKTYLGLRVVHESLLRGKRALFIADRITLIDQTSTTADRFGLSAHGIMQGDHWRVNEEPFQIASAQTLRKRQFPKVDVIIIDEAHTQMGVWVDYIKSLADLPANEGPKIIGLSATPFSRGLGLLFTRLVNAATMHELVELGVLVPMRIYSCVRANMQGAATSGGEWTDGAAAARGMEIVGDVVRQWQEFGENRKTICFGATIEHCKEIARQFNEAGIMAAVFCADTTAAERKSILQDYRGPNPVLRVLVSVEALAKGFDVPDVGCIIDCRPLRKSLSTFIQIIGRGARSHLGKTDFILLDHSGNIVRFREDFEDVYFNGLAELDAGEKLDGTVRKDEDEKDVKACPKCSYKPFGKRCMACGFEKPAAPSMEHENSAGTTEILFGKKKAASDKRDLYNQIATWCRGHGNPASARGRCAHFFREMTGAFPPPSFGFDSAPNVPITQATRNKITQGMMAYRATQQR